MLTPSKTLHAIFLMVSAMFCFAAMGIVIRLLATEMSSEFMVLLRNSTAVGMAWLWAAWVARGIPRFTTNRIKSHFWRASVGVISMELWFYALSVMPLTLATALSFTTPIFATIFAVLFLGEKAGVRRWSAIAVGFVGVMVILHPDASGLDPKASLVLLSSAMIAVSTVLVKSLTRTEKPETIVFYMALFMVPWSIPIALPYLQPVTAYQVWLVFLLAMLSTAAHLMLTRAYVHTDMVVLAPFDFTRLLFIAVLAYAFFGETMDGYTVGGALIIVASTVYIAHREAKKHIGRNQPVIS